MPKTLSPLEQLRARKQALEAQTEQLEQQLGDHFAYLQSNWLTLLGGSAVSSLSARLGISSVSEGLIDSIPFFVRGIKGIVLQFVIRQLRKML